MPQNTDPNYAAEKQSSMSEWAMKNTLSTLLYIEDLVKSSQLLDVHRMHKEKVLMKIAQSKKQLEQALVEPASEER